MLLLQLLFFLLPLSFSFNSGLLFLSRKYDAQRGTGFRLQSSGNPTNRDFFFEIVESGLNDRESSENISLERIRKFCEYSKRTIPIPPKHTLKYMHDPCEEYIDELTAEPWWNKSLFTWSKELELVSPSIAAELSQVLSNEELFIGDSRYMNVMGKGWTAFRLQRFGEWQEENCELFPLTTQILKALNIPFASRGVMFAKQKPGTGVDAHSDGRNFILTAHVGLKIPKEKDKCWISVAGERRSWEENKVLLFDTSFMHETANESDEERYVLIIDFWHPDLTTAECEALTFIYDTRNKFDSGKISDIDCTYVTSGNNPVTLDSYVRQKKKQKKKFFGIL